MAATLKVLSAGAVKRGVAQVAANFGRASSTRVEVDFATAPQLRERVLGGEIVDVIVAPPAVMDVFEQHGKIVASTRGTVGRSRVGVVMHQDAAAPEVSDTAAFTRALRSASAVVYNTASSGIYIGKLLDRLGLVNELAARIVQVQSGSAIMEAVAARAPGAVGLAQISEIMVMIDKGCAVKLVAPLPGDIQNITRYDAAACTASATPPAALALAQELASAAAKKSFAASGID
jgi:molybdate transport system substrate-binding protein